MEPRQLLAGHSGSIETIYHEDFESGDGGYTANNRGGTLVGLWHFSVGRRDDGLPNHSPDHSWYYGEFETATGGGRYDDRPADHEGVVTSPLIDLPSCGETLLSFNYLLATRPELDIDFVTVAVTDGTSVTELLSRADGSLVQTGHNWITATADLTPFVGRQIRLLFSFDTGDAVPYDPEGWYFDDVRITNQVCTTDLFVQKSVDDPTPDSGQQIEYTITAANSIDSDISATGVVVTDLLPTGLTIDGFAATEGSYDPVTGLWTGLELDRGESQTLTVQASVAAGTAGQTLVNVAEITGDHEDPDPTNNRVEAPLVVNSVDLSLTKIADDDTPNAGQQVTYTITVTNDVGSNAEATGVVVQDVLPIGVTFISADPSSGTYDPNTGLWEGISVIAPGAHETLQLTIAVAAGTSGQSLTNTATASAQETDPDPSNNLDNETIVVNAVDVSTVKATDDDTPNSGQIVTYTLTVSNSSASNAAATGVEVTDTLPPGVTYVAGSASPAGAVFDNVAGTITWSGVDLAINDSQDFVFLAVVDPGTAGASLVNVATANGNETDPDPTNNTATATSTVNSVDLSVTKSVDDETPNPGQTTTYTIEVNNLSAAPASGVTVVDTLPAGVAYVSDSATPSGAVFDAGAGTLTWSGLGIAALGAAEFTFLATVDAGAAGDSIDNTVTVEGQETDPDLSNNTFIQTSVVNDVALTVTKIVDDDTPNEGQQLTYTITVSNAATSNVPATGVVVTEALPTGLTLVSADPSEGSYNPSTGDWDGIELLPDESATLLLVVTVDSGTAGDTLENNVTVDSDETQPQPGDPVVIVVNSVDLAIDKTASNNLPTEGDQITFTITVNNSAASNAIATNVAVADVLPSGVSYVSDVPSAGSYDPVSGQWTGIELAIDQSQTLEIVVSVDVGTAGETITNTATVTAAETDPNPGNNEASATLDVQQVVPQQIQFIAPLSVFRSGPFVIPADDQIAVLGRIWSDQDGDGRWDPGEPGLDGINVELAGSGGPIGLAQSRAVDLNGNGQIDPVNERGLYWFHQQGQIPFDSYTITIQLPTGEATSFPTSPVNQHSFDLNAATPAIAGDALQEVTPNFGVAGNFISSPPAGRGSIVGHSWADFDQDGQWDSEEPGRNGFRVFLDLNEDGNFDPDQNEPSSFTGADGMYVFGDLDPGTYIVRQLDETGVAPNRISTFPAGNAHAVTVAAGAAVQGSFGVVEAPNFGTFEYGDFVRPADQFLARASDALIAALRPWQSFAIDNDSGADFQITQIDLGGIDSAGRDFVTTRVIAADGSLVDPATVLPLTLADGESADFMVFYDPAIRSGATVQDQSPDWLGELTDVHTFAATDRLHVVTNTGVRFPVRLVGGSTFDSDITYDGVVNNQDIAALSQALSLELVTTEGESPRFDPTKDINARCPNGAGQQTGTCSYPIGAAPARQIAMGDFGPLNVELGRQRDAIVVPAIPALGSGEPEPAARTVGDLQPRLPVAASAPSRQADVVRIAAAEPAVCTPLAVDAVMSSAAVGAAAMDIPLDLLVHRTTAERQPAPLDELFQTIGQLV